MTARGGSLRPLYSPQTARHSLKLLPTNYRTSSSGRFPPLPPISPFLVSLSLCPLVQFEAKRRASRLIDAGLSASVSTLDGSLGTLAAQ
ncbi:hypothetical protein FA13DRAFT_891916 [Coprinellus micaceus]|uniref:Uncharacterized protein n=1 Tax=Coprinellus micaceus TaxID=71717 RepID=A0A4Y7TSR0_COPMI|nr:hypothetical protein FA13DRAFT_891916 [Coprinellus micaceus]